MRSIVSVLFIVISCISCCANTVKPAPHSEAGNSILINFPEIARNEFGLILLGKGGGFIDTINTISFDFVSFEEVNQDQARRLYLKVLDRLLSMINSDSIRPYLHHYPFTHRDVKLMISFYKKGELNYVNPPYVALVFRHSDIMEYATKNPETFEFEDLPNESIQRARGIIQHQDMLKQIPQDCGWVR